jgi:hypothetical protein
MSRLGDAIRRRLYDRRERDPAGDRDDASAGHAGEPVPSERTAPSHNPESQGLGSIGGSAFGGH